MSSLFVTEYLQEIMKLQTCTGLTDGFCYLVLSLRIVLNILSVFGNLPIIGAGIVSIA